MHYKIARLQAFCCTPPTPLTEPVHTQTEQRALVETVWRVFDPTNQMVNSQVKFGMREKIIPTHKSRRGRRGKRKEFRARKGICDRDFHTGRFFDAGVKIVTPVRQS